MTAFNPFADDSAELTITGGDGTLTIENGTECVSLFGELDITRDHAGLHRVRQLKIAVDAVAAALEAADLPTIVNVVAHPTQRIKNPLAQDGA